MAHSHQHQHLPAVGLKLLLATAATLLFVGVEVGVGVAANSLALIGDALHNFTDALALVVALSAVTLARRAPTSSKSFGYQRAGVLAAFVNAGVLVGVTIFVFVEAVRRILLPEPVNTLWMIYVAAAAVVLNSAIAFSLRQEGRDDINIRSAVLHVLSDALASLGILLGALLIRWTGKSIFDPIISVGIGVVILMSSWGILRETVNLLLEGTPRGIDPEAVTVEMGQVEGVRGVHHLHIWALAPSSPALSCHVLLGDVSLKSTREVFSRINAMLGDRFHISHATIQFEHVGCPEDDPFCAINPDR
ncbi:MAG TPA: cation diffusion facilitator family transporter [Thermoanaerobaculia bacterium]|nr:cation diffusion facilitator family transporter [Thermoanaerobaculia bacterium]